MVMSDQSHYVLRTVEERGIRFVQLWFTDVLGRHKAFHVTPAELATASSEHELSDADLEAVAGATGRYSICFC